MSSTKISISLQSLLRCPICHSKLAFESENVALCTNYRCGVGFPIVDGIPVIINEHNSIFSINDFTNHRNTTFNLHENTLFSFLGRVLPDISINIRATENYKHFANLLLHYSSHPRILIVGGSIPGKGMHDIFANKAFELVESDVSFGPRTTLICDAHDIPFEDEVFDGVVIQAVLEHVLDPYRCVAELHRVLKVNGIVYAETPFMQQVHMGEYDYTRFTYLGHRRLFREFDELESGAVCGPGMALVWSYHYFMLSFTTSHIARAIVGAFTRLTGFYLKYFDYLLINKPGALDAASGLFFMGLKAGNILSDRDLIKQYKGAQRRSP